MGPFGAYSGTFGAQIGIPPIPIYMVADSLGPASFRRLEIIERKP
jgi:hypothetical protein